MNFWSSKKGGGSFSTQKFILQILGYKKSKIRVLGMFLSTIVLRKSKTRHTLKKACTCISYYLVLIPPCIYVTISIIKKMQHNFPKMRGGSKAVWNFSKNSSDLVAWPFPKSYPLFLDEKSPPPLWIKYEKQVSSVSPQQSPLHKVVAQWILASRPVSCIHLPLDCILQIVFVLQKISIPLEKKMPQHQLICLNVKYVER